SGVRQIGPRVVVVDDGSSDRMAEEALAAGATVLRHAVNLGQGAALQTGIEYVLAQGAQHVFTFDVDGQHASESLIALVEVLQKTGVDVVLGSRTLGSAVGIPKARKFLLKAALAFTRLHAAMPVTDTHNGLRLFICEAASRIRIRQARM